MDVYWLQEARRAADTLRVRGRAPLPLAEAYHLDRSTQRLLAALIELGILAAEDVPGYRAAPRVETELSFA